MVMKKIVRYVYNALRTVVVTLIVAFVLAFALPYALLCIPSVQEKIKTEGEKELSDLLKTQVTIDHINISPFNRVVLERVNIPDQQGDSLFAIDKLGAGLSLFNLLTQGRLVFTYGEIIGLHGRITRPDKDSPTNMQFLIDAFKPKPDQPPKPFDLKIFNVVMRKCDVRYDVLSEPVKNVRFDVNHIAVSNFRADLALPRLKNNDFDIDLKRLSFDEKSGFVLKNLSTHVTIDDTCLTARDIQIELPHSDVGLSDIELHYTSLKNLGSELPQIPIQASVANSQITPSDLAAFVPSLRKFDEPLRVTAAVKGTRDYLDIPVLNVKNTSGTIDLEMKGTLNDVTHRDLMSFNVPHLKVSAQSQEIAKITSSFANMSPRARDIITRCGNVDVDGQVKGSLQQMSMNGSVNTSLGNVVVDGKLSQGGGVKQVSGTVKTPMLQVGRLLARENLLGEVAMDAELSMTLGKGIPSGSLNGHIDHVDIRGYRYHNIEADLEQTGRDVKGLVTMDDPNGRLVVDGDVHLDGMATNVDVHVVTEGLSLYNMGLMKKYPDHKLSANLDANFSGNRIDNVNGSVAVSSLTFVDKEDHGIHLDHLNVDADNTSPVQSIDISSDYMNGYITGSYNVKSLVPSVKHMLWRAFPQFFADYEKTSDSHKVPNNLRFKFEVDPNEELQEMAKLPVRILYKSTVDGHIDEESGTFSLNVNAPYLLQGKKNIIESTRLSLSQDSTTHNVSLAASTLFPNKKGKIAVNVTANGGNDRIDSDLSWRVMRDRDFHGNLNLSALLRRGADKKVGALIDVNPSELVFNDTVWNVQPGTIEIDHDVITVQNLAGQCDKQFIRINGRASHDPEDALCLQLNDVSLDYIFETLNIDNVDFGGRATGKFFASDLFSGAPRLLTPNLHVVDLSYNNAVMGDADIESHWVNETKAVALNADIQQHNGKESVIGGDIFVADDSLYLTFDADHANVSFLKPFMAAFTSDVGGEVSGHAVLYGNFHTINLYGDVCADSLLFKLDYTNVYYTCSGDSVHMKPNLITFKDVIIHDRDGHSAKMGGWLRHDSFHDPVFNFGITDADKLLCYDTDASINPVWFGTVYGSGSAFVTGEPGVVDIKVNMQSDPSSRFTFVMSDSQEASEYNFITFRDRDKKDLPEEDDEAALQDSIPEIVRQLTQRVQQNNVAPPTAYTIDLQGDITPDVQLFIIMDPIGGDQIKCTGHGNLRLTYNNNDEMAMYGKYTLERGNYNFTLQDIIIKDFTIRDGSSISFQGDPYAAQLDLEAVYSLNANLKDLDESFAADKEINRTNVPVHALLRAKGLINEPDISFDLEFPSLTTDAYRKVKSIINTEDQMNRQIIYLLALNRFYTPEYMNGSTNNNELSSVASSTISSQLSSILGKMSENWTIAPNFRSEKGDFSDMEVDLALSSQLLNNRLLFNGNFGYRDNTYNTRNSNFIGDFDIEYLLNAKGTWRLKAYNHFNDQNYYVRNALTTQGVGIVLKRDFDSPFNVLRRKKSTASAPADSIVSDSVPAYNQPVRKK